jgi:hypothetical protein
LPEGEGMSGHKIKLGKSARIKDGKVITVQHYWDASHAIRCKTSKKQKVKRRVV